LNLNLSAIREESVSSDSVNNNNNNSNSNSNNSNNTSDVILTENLKNIFGKPLSQIATKIKSTSPFKSFKTYHLKSFIAKANDDLRQELLAMQLIKKFNQIFTTANIPLKLHPYEILITSSSSGLLEFLHNTNSIDNIKKHISATNDISLNYFYRNYFKDDFPQAQRNFTESLAAYCLICYYLRIKDRHNGNILIDMHGAVIHIDFGFILGINPGNINFERAPFKLTSDYINIMDGEQSTMYTYFKELMVKGMIESKRHVESIVNCVEIMAKGGGKMPCFENKDTDSVIKRLRERFHERTNDYEFTKIVDDLIYASKDNFWTNKYDKFQQITNGIMP
jgi:phosphatidylinositol 4-kinase